MGAKLYNAIGFGGVPTGPYTIAQIHKLQHEGRLPMRCAVREIPEYLQDGMGTHYGPGRRGQTFFVEAEKRDRDAQAAIESHTLAGAVFIAAGSVVAFAGDCDMDLLVGAFLIFSGLGWALYFASSMKGGD